MSTNLLIAPKTLPTLGAGLAVVFWLIDSLIDAYVFEEGSLTDSIFTPEPVEFWMRSLVVVMLVGFALFAKRLLAKQNKMTNELNQYKDQLERLVEERTSELRTSNTKLQQEIQERKKAEQELEELATTDSLTKLHNRRKFTELLIYEMEKNRRYRSGLALILCDIDYFKRINDNFGHDIGDDVLKIFADKVKKSIRKSDVFARWGGEEFVLLIPDTNAEIAKSVADKIRKVIEQTDFPNVGNVTASFGVTHFFGEDSERTLIKRADEALYNAKANGRNTVAVVI